MAAFAFGRIASVSVALLFLFSFSEARNFTLGGNEKAWNDSNQAHLHDWAGRNRFQVGDELKFTGPVAQVESLQEFNSCNSSSPSKSYQSGDTAILNRRGYFYFISQRQSNCYSGQKVIVLVMTPRNNKPSSNSPAYSPASAPSPASGIAPGSGAGRTALGPTSGAGGLRVGGGGLVFGLGVLVLSLFF